MLRSTCFSLLILLLAFATSAIGAPAPLNPSPTPSQAEVQLDDAPSEGSDATPTADDDEAAQSASLLAAQQNAAARAALVGVWRATIGSEQVELALHRDGQFALNGQEGIYQRGPGRLLLHLEASPSGDPPRTLAYDYSFVNQQLELSGGDLEAPVTFIRQFSLPLYIAELFDTDVADIWQRLNRIVFIVIVVAAAGLFIALLRRVVHALVFTEWGPLGLLYRNRKNRARTIYSIVLNLVKYFIYFTALGMIMAELGVNYMTYVASLSVIGLAIGFGSQGLVQDMVTGFFIIFEGQFDVGDMVEISGQSGYVTELGLRMTKLRNYLGQTVVIPNRNIVIVGNYSRGAQRAYVDVPVQSAEEGWRAIPLLQQLAEELLKQYEGVAMGPLKVTGPTTLETGEQFVRLHLSIWPGQVWVIDQQLLPRLRETLKRAQVEIVNDRVGVFYHARQPVATTNWAQRLPWRRNRSTPPPPEAEAPAP